MASKDSVAGTIKVALILCVVCSVFISSAAVILKPFQVANKLLDRNKNILSAAGMFDPALNSNAEVDELFARFTIQVVELDSGEILSAERLAELGIDPATYDERSVFSDTQFSDVLGEDEDIADLKRRIIITDSKANIFRLICGTSNGPPGFRRNNGVRFDLGFRVLLLAHDFNDRKTS
jgi:Na+-transporting NADH:ubiquinone oxidoreductase subunit C